MRLLKSEEKVRLMSNGHLHIDNSTHTKVMEKDFCIENFYDPKTDLLYLSGFVCTNDTTGLNFFAF